MSNESSRRANQKKYEIQHRHLARQAARGNGQRRNNWGNPEPSIGWVYVLLVLLTVALIVTAATA